MNTSNHELTLVNSPHMHWSQTSLLRHLVLRRVTVGHTRWRTLPHCRISWWYESGEKVRQESGRNCAKLHMRRR